MRNKKIILAVILCLSVLAMGGCGAAETSQKQAAEALKDSEIQRGDDELESIYLKAKDYLSQKDYGAAISELEKIPDYKDVKELLQNARYEYGISLYDKSQYAQAIEQLEQTTDYKETEKYLDKCRMELKYEKFDYDSFTTLGDDSVATMTNKEIREYMEECMNSMYSSWYQQDENNEEIIIDKYFIDGKEYGIASWGGEGNYTEFDIYYMDSTEDRIHISLAPDFAYMNVSENPTMMLSIGDMLYFNYTSSQAKEYAELNEAQQEEYESAQPAEYYLPGYAYSNSLGAYVYYAYVEYDKEQKTNVVKVECTIGNIGSSNIQFVAGNYFSLNYNGVITSARTTQYDYTTLAPGGQFTTELVFNCPSATRVGDTLNMTMTMENAQIHLGPVPLDAEERSGFVGTYMSSSASYDIIITVMDNGDGTYNITYVGDALGTHRIYENVSLKEKNKFDIGANTYTWDEVDNILYSYGDLWGETYKTEYYMQNPMK